MKLIRVMNGLYRSENGAVRVAHQLPWRGKPAHWTVRWTDWMSAEHVREFPTLAEARAYLNSENGHG